MILLLPLHSTWEAIYPFVECVLVLEWWLGPVLCLSIVFSFWFCLYFLMDWTFNSQLGASKTYLSYSGQHLLSTTPPTPIPLGLQMVPIDLGLVSSALLWFFQNSSEQSVLPCQQIKDNPQPINGCLQLPHLPPLLLVLLYLVGLCILMAAAL